MCFFVFFHIFNGFSVVFQWVSKHFNGFHGLEQVFEWVFDGFPVAVGYCFLEVAGFMDFCVGFRISKRGSRKAPSFFLWGSSSSRCCFSSYIGASFFFLGRGVGFLDRTRPNLSVDIRKPLN